MSGIDIEGVSFRYPRGALALDDVSLETSPGTVALLGPNGAGKSTLMSLLVGAVRSQQGVIRIAGQDVTTARGRRALQQQLGYVPQDLRMYGGYTATELLRYVAWLKRVPANDVTARIRGALEVVDLSDHASSRVSQLSGGTRQRLAIAQALVNDPAVLVLDEPTAGLDPEHRADIRAYLADLAVGRLVVIASHLVEDVAVLAEQVVVLNESRVRFAGSASALAKIGGSDEATGPALESGYVTVVRGDRPA